MNITIEELPELDEDEKLIQENLKNMKVGEVIQLKIDGELISITKTKEEKVA